MNKKVCFPMTALILSMALGSQAEAQIVTSFYAPPSMPAGTSMAFTPGAVLTPAVAPQPITAAPIVGTIPVRRGLFGLRTEHVPVFAGAPVLAAVPTVAPVSGAVTVARPIVSAYSVPSSSVPFTAAPYSSARPIIVTSPMNSFAPMHTSGTAGALVNPVLPNALIQSGYRGAVPGVPMNSAPIIVAPSPFQFNATPFNSFSPGAVMTMQ